MTCVMKESDPLHTAMRRCGATGCGAPRDRCATPAPVARSPPDTSLELEIELGNQRGMGGDAPNYLSPTNERGKGRDGIHDPKVHAAAVPRRWLVAGRAAGAARWSQPLRTGAVFRRTILEYRI
eukprot:gene11318-biopygen8732